MVDFIDIKNLFGIKKDIALECDKDGNGKLEKTKDFDEADSCCLVVADGICRDR